MTVSIRFSVAICLCVAASSCWAQDGHKLLFESGEEGYPRYRIPSLVVTNKGTLLAICEGRSDGGGLTGNVDLVLKRSEDGGKTWSPLKLVADAEKDTLGNQSALVDRETGVIWIAHTISPGAELEVDIAAGRTERSSQVYVISSADDGETWTKPRDISDVAKKPGWTWYGCGPGVGIQLKSGRLFFPCYHREGENGSLTASHAVFSDDHGKTWKLSENAGAVNGEPQALEREDGSIYLSARTAKGGPFQRSIVESPDGGETWSEKRFDPNLYDPYCQNSLLKLAPKRWLLLHPAGPDRIDLTVRLSLDEGKSWDAGSMLLRAGNGQYSSMALLPNGEIGVFYDLWEDGNYQLYFTTFSPAQLTRP
ncbi:MAG: sialidase-1 [Verrucomicrobiales bacterium]|jgi:sialidase-1